MVERQRERIKQAKAQGASKGGTPKLTRELARVVRDRVGIGIPKAKVARELDFSRQAMDRALQGAPGGQSGGAGSGQEGPMTRAPRA